MTDIFDPLLRLEEDFYDEGYAQGHADGAEAGLIEGRIFGLEKGFEKFLEVGKLQGKCSVWKTRLGGAEADSSPPLGGMEITNPRIQKNVQTLELLLTHVPYKNDDEAVEEVEETLKKAKIKARMVERMLGEKEDGVGGGGEEGSIEDAGKAAAAALGNI